MNKRYFWIYILPVLMVTTVIGFGMLGVKSAVNEQKMQAELAKIDWGSMSKGDVSKLHNTDEEVLTEEERLDYRVEQIEGKHENVLAEYLVDSAGRQVGTTKILDINSWSEDYITGDLDENTSVIMNFQNEVLMKSDEYDFWHLDGDLFYKRPVYGKRNNTVVFNLKTGEIVADFSGDWFFHYNALGYEAETYDMEAATVAIYFDHDFHEITRLSKGRIHVGLIAQEAYWLIDGDGRRAIVDSNLRVMDDYGTKLLGYTDFSEGLALLYFRNKLVCVDEKLNVIFEKKAHIWPYFADGSHYEKNSIVKNIPSKGFVDGLAVFTLDAFRYGILDSEGNVVIEPVFKGRDTLSLNGLDFISVSLEDKQHIGKIKREGEEDIR